MVPFEKWEGLGNDFIVLERSDLARDLGIDEVRSICDRHRGVGGDGVLLVVREPDSKPRMVVLNADGSRPEMCGNGLRCVLGHLIGDEKAGVHQLTVRTDAGDLACQVERITSSGVEKDLFSAEIDMGRARIEPVLSFDEASASGLASEGVPAEGLGRRHLFDRVNMGNPHAITFETYTGSEIDRISPRVETLPEGHTNVEFVHLEGEVLVVKVWERGVGYTLACGTGACAALVAACKRGLTAFGRWTTVRLPGGDLSILVDEATLAVRMKGPARRVFTGELVLR